MTTVTNARKLRFHYNTVYTHIWHHPGEDTWHKWCVNHWIKVGQWESQQDRRLRVDGCTKELRHSCTTSGPIPTTSMILARWLKGHWILWSGSDGIWEGIKPWSDTTPFMLASSFYPLAFFKHLFTHNGCSMTIVHCKDKTMLTRGGSNMNVKPM